MPEILDASKLLGASVLKPTQRVAWHPDSARHYRIAWLYLQSSVWPKQQEDPFLLFQRGCGRRVDEHLGQTRVDNKLAKLFSSGAERVLWRVEERIPGKPWWFQANLVWRHITEQRLLLRGQEYCSGWWSPIYGPKILLDLRQEEDGLRQLFYA